MKSTLIFKILLILAPVAFLGSCIPNKKIVYMQNANNQADSIYPVQINNYRLQKGDIVGIDVKLGTENPVLRNVFAPQAQNMNVQGGGDFYYLNGFPLDDSGFISLPIIGKVLLEGKTIFEANTVVQQAFDSYLTNVFVMVRFGGLRFSVLGEVARPGKFLILQNRMTIFEAIANAGDMTELARRNKVILLRQYPNGSKIHELNLLDENIISSPYYYIQPNDMIYVEPMKIRALGTGYTGFQTFTSVLAAVASTLLIINLVR